MRIENLREGMEVKNYKELCKLLDEPIKAGNSKKSQLENFERFFTYHKNKYQFVIDTIYKQPFPEKIKGSKTKYVQEIQDILTYYIYKNRNKDNELVLSFSKLIEILGFANPTYSISNIRKKELSDILNIELTSVYYFYNNSRCEFKKIIKRALNNLKRRSVIFYNEIIIIAEKSDTKINGRNVIKYRKATKEEIQMILDTQRIVMEELKIDNCFFINNRKYKKYIKMVMKELPPEWIFYYSAYELLIGDYAIQSEYKIVENRRKELNKKSIDRMSKYLKVLNETDNEKILIDKLINLNNYNPNLDKQILELYEENKKNKFNKIIKNNNKIKKLEQENFETEENFKNRDSIDETEYFNYIKNKKENDNLNNWGVDYNTLINLFQ